MAGTVGAPGMLRSSTITFGWWNAVSVSALSTSPASATTRKSGSASSSSRSPVRTIAWSSASTISIGFEPTWPESATVAQLYPRDQVCLSSAYSTRSATSTTASPMREQRR